MITYTDSEFLFSEKSWPAMKIVLVYHPCSASTATRATRRC